MTFDLLVSDIALPDATGCELLEELRTKYGLRGIAMSGFGSDADLEQSRKAGFLEHLVKPIDAKALDTVIQRLAPGL
jgi:CheY-like chemotaxis protein